MASRCARNVKLSVRQVIAVDPNAGRARGPKPCSLEKRGLLPLERLEANAGGKRLFARVAGFGCPQEGSRCLCRRRSNGGRSAMTDRLNGARFQKLGPHLSKQAVRRINVGAVDLA